MPFDVGQMVAELTAAEAPKLSELFVRMGFATVLGAAIAFRAWRRFMPFMSRPSLQSAQAQTLIPAAGAVMVVVIGDSPARAFGLVGLGSFIRFRSGISDPRDAAVLFVMIGIGMACGVGAVPLAMVATLFASVVLTIFDAGRRARLRMTKVSINATEPSTAWERIHLAFPGARVLELPGPASTQPGKLVMETALADDMDAAGVMRLLQDKQVPGINSVSIDENGKGGVT